MSIFCEVIMKKQFCHLIVLSSTLAQVFASDSLLTKFQTIEPTIQTRMEEYMSALGIPGAAIAIVIDGKIVHQSAHGLRDIEHVLPVTTKTLFPVGSLSKSMTAFTIGSLVDDGILSFDDPISKHIPYFRLQDPYVTYEITIRDYLTHISGYPKHDGTWFANEYTRPQLISKIKYLEPVYRFREKFLYQNIGYTIVGEAAECATNKPFEDLVSQRIFKPLKMNSTHFSYKDLLKTSDRALGYRQSNRDLVRCPDVDAHLINAAGGVNSTLEDITLYLQSLLRQGSDIVSKPIFREITSPQVVTNVILKSGVNLEDEIFMESYGLGLFIVSYKGELMIVHGGNIEGHSAALLFFPKRNLGMVVLCNKNLSPFPYIITTLLADNILDLTPSDWVRKCLEYTQYDVPEVQRNQPTGYDYRHQNTEISHPIHEYVGVYHNPGYGELSVNVQNDHLVCTYNKHEIPLNHWHYDVFEVSDSCDLYFLRGIKMNFQGNPKGNIHSLSIPFEPMVADIKFIKEKKKRTSEITSLEKYIGDYSYYGFSFTISQQNNQLVVSAMDQPPYVLTHIKNNEFAVEGFDDYIVVFNLSESGESTAVTLFQPNNLTVTANRF